MEDVSRQLFDLTPDTLVKLVVYEEDENEESSSEPTTYQGYCTAFEGQADNFDNYIILREAVDLSHNEKMPRPLIINFPEITQVEIVTTPDTEDDKDLVMENDSMEIILDTVVIEEKQHLELLMNVMEDLEALACSFEGKSIGRFGVVTWIILVAKNTLIPLNIKSLARKMGDELLWKKLGTQIFSNPKIVKVFYDCRGPADYLFHQHGISLKNIFDAQVADVYVQKIDTGIIPTKYKSLSDCLRFYCTVSFSDIKIIEEYEKNIERHSSSWLGEPFPSASVLKLGAVKVKHLIPLRENLLRQIQAKYSSTVANHLDHCIQIPIVDSTQGS